ncbi:MAG: hypothetical protein VZR64_00410 [Eubacterium sp.]|nr:hypothetical protein [Eubacterium sp.]
MKLNTGLKVTYTLTYPNGDTKEFVTDGYVIRDIAESICSARTIATLDWSNKMGSIKDPKDYVLSESSAFATNEGFFFDVESQQINTEENYHFNTQAAVCEALEELCNQL